MPQVNLTKASGQELRQWLDVSRRSGEAALTYKILQEMAARRETPPKPRVAKGRRSNSGGAPEPRLVTVEFGEAVADDDDVPPMPNWPPPPQGVDDETLETALDPEEFDRPLDLGRSDPEAGRDGAAYIKWPANPRGGPSFKRVAGVTLTIGVGLAMGWLGGWLARDAMSERAAPAPAPAVIRTAALTPPPAPPVTPPPVAVPPPEPPSVVEPTPEAVEAPVTVVEAEAPVPDGAAMELPTPLKTVVAAPGCAKAATPADREICGDERLQDLQRDLRRAYAEALDAHENRALLRERQLAWRDARNTVTDPSQLARLYEQRIQKLHAAAVAARAQR